MRKQQIQHEASATIWFRFPEGTPSPTPTVSITRASGAALSPVVTGALAAIDSAGTTISSWSSDSPKTVEVADASGFVPGRVYRITNAHLQTFDVKVVGVSVTSKELLLDKAPPWDLAATWAVTSSWVSFDLAASQTALAEANYQAVWEGTIAGAAYRHQEPFDVVRQIPYMVATPAGLYQYSPALITDWEVSATQGGNWSPRLETAFGKVLDDLDALGLRAHLLLDWLQVEVVTYEAVLLKLADESYVPAGGYDGQGANWMKERRHRYAEEFAKLRTTLEGYDANNDGKPDEPVVAYANGSRSVR